MGVTRQVMNRAHVTPGNERSTMNCDKPFCRSCGSPDERTSAIM